MHDDDILLLLWYNYYFKHKKLEYIEVTVMYNIAICDDNPEFLKIMEKTIEANPEYDEDMKCHKFLSGKELLNSEIGQYSLIIIDMQMEQMDGYMTAKKLREKNKDVVLAFCSGIIMPAPEHFEVQPYRYILKKIDVDKMQKNISDLLIEMKNRKKNCMIEVAGDGKAYRLNINDIIYIYRLKRGSVFVVEQGETWEEIQSNEKLDVWYQQLSNEGFEFAHTSYIVNMKKIVRVVKDDILMSNSQILRVSRTCKQKFHARFSYYFSKKYRRNIKND